MAERKETVIIDVQITDAVKKLQETANEITRLKEANENLSKRVKEGGDATGVFSRRIQENKIDIKDLTAAYREQEKQILTEIKVQKENEGSIAQMRGQLSLLTKQYDSLSQAERTSARGTELLKKIQLTTENLRLAEEETGRFQRSVGNYPQVFDKAGNSVGNLKSELKEITAQLAAMRMAGQKNTEEYKRLAERGGELKDTLSDVKEEMTNLGSDTRGVDQAIAGFEMIGSAAQLAQGATALLGSENEEIARSIQKMVAIESMLNAVKRIGLALQKESTFMIGVAMVKEKAYQVAKIVTTNLERIFGITAAQAWAAATLGVSLLITGIVLLIGNFKQIIASVKSFFGITDKFAETKQNIDENTKALERFGEVTDLNVDRLKAEGKTDKEILEFKRKRYNEQLKKERKLYGDLKSLGDKATDEQKDRLKQSADFIKNQSFEFYKLKTEEININKKANEEKLKSEQEALKKINEEEKKANENSKKIAQDLQDTLILNTKKGVDLEIEQEKIATARKIEELKNQKDLTEKGIDDRNKLIEQLQIQSDNKVKEIEEKALKEKLKEKAEITIKALQDEIALQDLKNKELRAGRQISWEEEKSDLTKKHTNELAQLDAKYTEEQKKTAEYLNAKKLLEQQYATDTAVLDAQIEEQKAQNEANRRSNELASYGLSLDAQSELKKQQIDADMANELSAANLTASQILAIENKAAAAKKKIDEETFDAKLSAAANVANAIANIAGKETELGKAAATAAITIQAIQGGIAAVTQGVAQLGPIAGAIVGGVQAAAIGASAGKAIADVWAVEEPKPAFARGLAAGAVQGNPLAGDVVTAKLTAGERILNQSDQDNLFKMIASGSFPQANGIDYELLAKAVSNLPAPIMDYKEFTSFQEKITTLKEFTKI